jgi:hypothetical protein
MLFHFCHWNTHILFNLNGHPHVTVVLFHFSLAIDSFKKAAIGIPSFMVLFIYLFIFLIQWRGSKSGSITTNIDCLYNIWHMDISWAEGNYNVSMIKIISNLTGNGSQVYNMSTKYIEYTIYYLTWLFLQLSLLKTTCNQNINREHSKTPVTICQMFPTVPCIILEHWSCLDTDHKISCPYHALCWMLLLKCTFSISFRPTVSWDSK